MPFDNEICGNLELVVSRRSSSMGECPLAQLGGKTPHSSSSHSHALLYQQVMNPRPSCAPNLTPVFTTVFTTFHTVSLLLPLTRMHDQYHNVPILTCANFPKWEIQKFSFANFDRWCQDKATTCSEYVYCSLQYIHGTELIVPRFARNVTNSLFARTGAYSRYIHKATAVDTYSE